MSVILDALKRVQEEDQRRDEETPERESHPPGEDDALLRRLAEPRPEPPENRSGGSGISPLVWASLAVVVVVGAVALGLWWMAPSVEGPNANEDRPLLADLTGAAERAEGESGQTGADGEGGARGDDGQEAGSGSADGTAGGGEPPHTEETSPPMEIASDDENDSGRADGENGSREAEGETGRGTGTPETGQRDSTDASSSGDDGQAPIWAPPRDADLSDLSGDVGEVTESAGGAEEDSEGYLRFEVAEDDGREAGQQSSGSDVQIDSSGGLAEERESTSGRSTVPSQLVDPGVRDAFQEGVRLQRTGQLQRAEKAYKRALKFDPHNARVNLNLGVLYEQQDKLPLAERHLRQAIAVEPDHANSHNNLGVVLYRMGNYDAALIEFDRALAQDPELLDAYANKGLIFTRWGRYDDAERAFLQVLALESDHALSHYNLGLVYEETDQLEKAVQRYETFLRLGASDYPEITSYLSGHLDWLEGRLGTSGAGRSDQR